MSSSAKRIRLESSRQLQSRETTIEKIYDDVLAEIFSYLSPKELKCAALVYKKWNKAIGSSAGNMKKFRLKVKESELLCQQFRSARNYQHIELEMQTTGKKPLGDQKSMANLGRFFELSQVKYFKINAYNPFEDKDGFKVCFNNPWGTFSIDATKLTAALKQMQQLQEFEIECPKGFRGSFTTPIELPKLTKIAVNSPDTSILQWIDASNVTEIDLIYRSKGSFGATVNVQHLAGFLKNCKQITALKMKSTIIEDLFGDGKWKDFNLKLSDLYIDLVKEPDATRLIEFLTSQTPSLTSLRIESVHANLSDSVRNSIIDVLSQLKNLKTLFLEILFGLDVTFLKQMPELGQLTLNKLSDINSIARFNRKLTYLKIEVVQNSLDAGLVFSELKYLYTVIDPMVNYLKVITNSPKIETVELGLSNVFDDAIIRTHITRVVMQQPTLRHLKLKYWGNKWNLGHLEELFEAITSDYGSLKSLSVNKRVGPGRRCLEFLLPENRSEWNFEEQKIRLIETFSNN